MAATKVPVDAIVYATEYIKSMPLFRVQLQLLQEVSDYIWFAAPWRWTTGALPTAQLVNNQQDYPVTLPTDFEYGLEAYLVNTTDRSMSKDIEIVSPLPATPTIALKGQPTQMAITGAGVTGQYRFYPIPAGYNTNSPAPILQGQYKKTAPNLTQTNIYDPGTLILPDQYFRVFQLGVLAWAYKYADDARAGNVTLQGNSVSFSGARAEFEAELQMMREKEKLPLAQFSTSPVSKILKG